MTTRLEHLRMIRHFYFDKGDVTRYVDWPKAKLLMADDTQQALLEVRAAQKRLNIAVDTFRYTLRLDIEDEEEKEERKENLTN